ncbi:MAG: hypothetical protein M9897_01765 [Brumimicrobium sp.]|nr:hypothetical protein [Brumimicrobium sp.]
MQLDQSVDKKDARWICLYGINQKPTATHRPESEYFECRALNGAIHDITKEINQIGNRIHALEKCPYDVKSIIKSYRSMLTKLRSEKSKLEKELHEKLKVWQPELLTIVSSVKGIGKRVGRVNHFY